MEINILYFLLILSFSEIIAQEVKLPLSMTDNASGISTLYFGLDPAATNGIDPSLGESAFPPMPLTGAFDARFTLYSDHLMNLRRITNMAIRLHLPVLLPMKFNFKREKEKASQSVGSCRLVFPEIS